CVILHFALPISTRRPVVSSLLPYTTLFRSLIADAGADLQRHVARLQLEQIGHQRYDEGLRDGLAVADRQRRVEIGIGLQLQRHRSEEHTSELQSPCNLVCRLLLEKKHLKYS